MAEENAKFKKFDLIGKSLAHFELIEMLAAGGMARIYKARDTKLDRNVAVKVLMPELMETDDTLAERFEREARAIAALEHDNIITIHHYDKQDELYFLVMQYIDGKDLAKELMSLRRDDSRIDIDRALRILGQVASALDFAHSAGIIHRDVKPSNILLDRNDKAILTDFGLVLRRAVDQTMGTAFGTPRYISPEQALASERSVPQSDIYSLAVILYEILTGSPVFRADTPMQVALSHITEPPPPPRKLNPNIPETVEVEILKALSKDPEARHRSATEFIDKVQAAYAADPQAEKQAIPPPPVIPQKTMDTQAREGGDKTPVLPEVEAEKLRLKAAADKTPSVPPLERSELKQAVDKARAGQDSVDDKTAHLKPMPAAQPTPQNSETKKRRTPWVLIALLLAVVGGGTFLVASGTVDIAALLGGDSTAVVSDATENGTDAAITSETAEATVATTPTPVPPTQVAADEGWALAVSYDRDHLVIRNVSDSDFIAENLTLGRQGEADAISGESFGSDQIPMTACIQLTREERRFVASDWECLRNDGSGNVWSQFTLTSDEIFWTQSGVVNRFEVRWNGEVIASCPTGTSNPQTCEVVIPFE